MAADGFIYGEKGKLYLSGGEEADGEKISG